MSQELYNLVSLPSLGVNVSFSKLMSRKDAVFLRSWFSKVVDAQIDFLIDESSLKSDENTSLPETSICDMNSGETTVITQESLVSLLPKIEKPSTYVIKKTVKNYFQRISGTSDITEASKAILEYVSSAEEKFKATQSLREEIVGGLLYFIYCVEQDPSCLKTLKRPEPFKLVDVFSGSDFYNNMENPRSFIGGIQHLFRSSYDLVKILLPMDIPTRRAELNRILGTSFNPISVRAVVSASEKEPV